MTKPITEIKQLCKIAMIDDQMKQSIKKFSKK